MIKKFRVYVIVDSDGNELDRFFHMDHAEEWLNHYNFETGKRHFIVTKCYAFSE